MTQPSTSRNLSRALPDQERIEALAEYLDRTDVSDASGWEEGSDAVIERPELEQIPIRLPREDVRELKRRAGQAGIAYTTMMRMIVREYLRKSPER